MADELFDASSKIPDKDLQEFLVIEKQKAQFNAQVRKLIFYFLIFYK